MTDVSSAHGVPVPPPMRRPGQPVPRPAPTDPYAAVFRVNDQLFAVELKKYGFEWWANRFYQECPATERRKFFERVRRPDGSIKPNFVSNGPNKDIVAWRQLLDDMLAKGFEAYPDTFKSVDDTLFPPIRDDPHLRLGFRGELRQPAQVKTHNGCKPKAQIASLRTEMNMSQAWHPFSSGEARNKVYYRNGSGDNCLYTTVSVAYDFGTASKFPLLDDLRKDAPDAFGTATVEAKGIASAVAAMANQLGPTITKQHFNPNTRFVDNPRYNPGATPGAAARGPALGPSAGYAVRLLPCVRMNVYMFRVRSDVWNTQGYQAEKKNAEFPERAMAQVPWGDFLARVMIDRIHYGNDSNDGHLNIVHGYQLMHSAGEIRRLLGGGAAADAAVARFILYLRDICNRGRLNADGSGGFAFKTENTSPDVNIRKVIRIEPRTDWGMLPA